MTSVIERFRMGISAFREAFVSAGNYDTVEFGSFEGRRVRYEIMWSWYESTNYREIHKWASTYKTRYALYKYIRSIYNPTYRLGEYYKTTIWGGRLDKDAGNDGAIPIVTDNESIRPAIAALWRWSNWGTKKDTVSLRGAILGDQIIKVVDNGVDKVWLETVNPATVAELVKDDMGNVKGYTIIDIRESPNNGANVEYKEVAERDGQNVVYTTYMNDAPYAWNGVTAQWSLPYGFVPMVHLMHSDVGMDWGWPEIYPSRSKVHEVDDVASMLSDQIRKSINAKWVFTGARSKSTIQVPSTTTATTSRPEPEREEEGAIFLPDPNSKVVPLVAEINIDGVISHILEILKEIERDYPELRFDNLRASGTVSGEALRKARQPAEAKANQRRSGYDEALVKAQMMALSIGGFRKYRGFEGFNLDSYASGKLDHEIGQRPVFDIDPIDEAEEQMAFWQAANEAKSAGVPLSYYLQRAGWSKKDIAELAVMAELERRDATNIRGSSGGVGANQGGVEIGQPGSSGQAQEVGGPGSGGAGTSQ